MSQRLQNDIKYAEAILSNECKDEFRKIYTNTNEDLLLLFSKLDIIDKNILTVLSSADYLYMSYLFKAKSVECFDINPLTFRYFYLRKWLIQNGIIDIGFCSYEDVLRILMDVPTSNSSDEKESLLFWKEILLKMGKNGFYSNQLFTTIFNPFNSFYNDKLVGLSRILSSITPTFYNFDICDNSGINVYGKYDVVFISNILDYYRNNKSIESIIHNLSPHISKEGKIICAHIPLIANEDFSQALDLERKCFGQAFNYKQITCDENGEIKYYQYTRKNNVGSKSHI